MLNKVSNISEDEKKYLTPILETFSSGTGTKTMKPDDFTKLLVSYADAKNTGKEITTSTLQNKIDKLYFDGQGQVSGAPTGLEDIYKKLFPVT